MLCSEYHVPWPAERPVVLKPFLDCMDQVAEWHGLTQTGYLEKFREEFHNVYDSTKDAYWKPLDGFEFDVAVHAIFRAIWSSDGTPQVFTAGEQELVLKRFPLTAKAIGAAQWKTSKENVTDRRLETLKAGVLALFGQAPSNEQTASASAARSVPDSKLCDRLLRLRSEVDYLEKLWRDQYEMTQLAPESAASVSARERYQQRIQAAEVSLEELRPQVRSARKSGFQKSACSQQ